MGTATHDADFAMILPALTEIHRRVRRPDPTRPDRFRCRIGGTGVDPAACAVAARRPLLPRVRSLAEPVRRALGTSGWRRWPVIRSTTANPPSKRWIMPLWGSPFWPPT